MQLKELRKNCYCYSQAHIPVSYTHLDVYKRQPFTLLIGCDILRKYAAIIDMDKATVLLKLNEVEWTANLIEHRKAPPEHVIYYIREGYDNKKMSIHREVRSNPEDVLWVEKINEIRTFQTDNIDHVLTNEQR